MPVSFSLLLMLMLSCGSGSDRQEAGRMRTAADERHQVPRFDADSAYHFVARQVAFGPRVPNTEAHREAGSWLAEKLGFYADTLYLQETRVRAYDGTVLHIKNIVGVFQPENRRRVLLCAHWDSRPYADYDPDPANHYTPIDGANDGASGVGVLLEIARQISKQPTDVGIDIIFFDAEDYGRHRFSSRPDEDSWALGSQHWARSPHRPDYFARYGILLDMVGATDPKFKREGYSMLFAPNIVRKVWEIAGQAGYGHLFVNRDGRFIIDDHYYINRLRNIPTINIIHQDHSTEHGFFPQWHTLDDNMDVIDPYTLKAVGQTVLEVIYRER
ncbi:MAG: M28 family peptidase [Bacteroidales bacterium]|nr:M28 family peptidase [Bacteroidales bacterium]